MVTPVFISGFGRSGTTAVMSLLGTDPRMAFDRIYPYESRCLTYMMKAAMIAGGPPAQSVKAPIELCDADCDSLGPPPWMVSGSSLWPNTADWLSLMWQTFRDRLQKTYPGATHYAEKTPHWLPDNWRTIAPVRVLHTVRDPRDVFLSARDFARAKGVAGFATDSSNAADEARGIAVQLVAFAESERADRGRDDTSRLRYEDWIADPVAVASRMSDWLGLKFDAQSPEVSSNLEHHRTSANLKASVGRWRSEAMPAVVGRHLLPALGRYGADFGYDIPITDCDIIPDPQWPHSADGQWEATANGVGVTLLGDDAWMELQFEPFRAADFAELWLCVRSTTGSDNSLFWCRSGEDFHEDRVVHVPFRPGPHLQVIRFPMAKQPHWRGTITRLRIDVCNVNANVGTRADVRWIRQIH